MDRPHEGAEARPGRRVLHHHYPGSGQRKDVIPPVSAVGIGAVCGGRRGTSDGYRRRVADHRLQARKQTTHSMVDEAFIAQALVKGLDGVGQSAGVQSAKGFQ